MQTLGKFRLDEIYAGNARELAFDIPDGSIDLIFTDPVYENIEDYVWLARTATRVLKPTGAVLVWTNSKWLSTSMGALSLGGLTYRYKFGVIQETGPAPMNGKKIAKENNLLWYDIREQSKMIGYLPDGYQSRTFGPEYASLQSKHHRWIKSPRFTEMTIRAFECGIVFDPFCGGGTVPAVCRMLNKSYLAFEVEPEKAEQARHNVMNIQPPLPVPAVEQLGMGAA